MKTRHRLYGRLVHLVTCSFLVGGCSLGHDRELAGQLSPILHELDSSGAVVAARVIELPLGRELYAENRDRTMTPASNMKLVVTAAALEILGADYAFRTYLVEHGDDLVIVGGGDPALGDPRIARRDDETPETVLNTWARRLADRGVTRIRGDIGYDESFFEGRQLHPQWDAEDRVEWYACPVSGLNLNDNCVDVKLVPAKVGAAPEMTVVPNAPRQVVLVNAAGSHDERHDVGIRRAPEGNLYEITGVISGDEELQSKPVAHPGAFVADVFWAALQRNGVDLGGELKPVVLPRRPNGMPAAGRTVEVKRTPLSDVLWRTNTHSQNLFAECLAKATARQWAYRNGMARPGSWADAREAIPDALRSLGISTKGLVVDDGSGLSHGNKVTARLLTDLLRAMHLGPHAKLYRGSLSRAGVEGTLRNRMKELAGRVYAKTGYIYGVRTLSGYVRTKQGRWLAFSFLYNDIPGSVKPFEALQDRAVAVLADWTP